MPLHHCTQHEKQTGGESDDPVATTETWRDESMTGVQVQAAEKGQDRKESQRGQDTAGTFDRN